MRRHLPNLITLLNLLCGVWAIILTLEGQWQWAVYLMLTAAVFDFLDGFVARLLKAYSETGKQLDSLADMVSFGVLPGVFVYTLFKSLFQSDAASTVGPVFQTIILFSALLVPALSAIRLARFNVAEGDSAFFVGLATPAHAIFWAGLFWQIMSNGNLFGTAVNPWFLWAIMLIMAMHMLVPVPMYSLKFKHFRLVGNLWRYILLLSAVLILLISGIPGLSLVILLYIFLSLLNILVGQVKK